MFFYVTDINYKDGNTNEYFIEAEGNPDNFNNLQIIGEKVRGRREEEKEFGIEG